MTTSIPWRIVRTLILSYVLSVILLFAMTFLLYKFRLSESQVSAGIYAAYILSCLIGGFAAGKSMKSRRFFWGMLVGTLYFFILLGISFLQEQGFSAETSELLTVLGICAGSGMVGGVLS